MKKLLLFVIACTLGLFSTVNAQNRLSSITYANESNNVTYIYESETSNKVVEVRHGVYNEENKWQDITFLTYNADGQLVSTEKGSYYDEGGIDKESYYASPWTIVEYTYTDGKLASYIVKEYVNWKLYQEPCDIKEYTLVYEGDKVVEANYTEKEYNYGWNNWGPYKLVYTYDDNDKLIKEELFYKSGEEYFSNNQYVEYTYDAAGNCISSKNESGEITDYIYDLTKLSADTYTFSFPHEVKPVSTNIVANTETYRYETNGYWDEEKQEYVETEPTKGEVTAATYHYTFETVAKPVAPVIAAGAVTETTVELSWSAVDGATSYNVYVGEAAAVSVKETTYTATDLTPATEYTFTVTAVNEGGESSASNLVKVTTEALTPLAPVAAATKVTDTEITLAWEAVAKATSYNVYVGEATEAVSVKETTYTATGLTPETEYSFVVTAANEHGESSKPEAVVVKTKAAKVVLPENMVAIGDGDDLATHIPFELCNMSFNEYTQSTFYGVSQQLYTAEEIAKEAGYIKSYALKFAGPKTGMDFETAAEQEDVVVELEIYVQNTELEVLQEGQEQASTQIVERKDLYYAGKTTLVNGDWTTFEFDYPFEYTGGNIIVTIYGISVENGKANFYPFYVYSSESIQTLQCSTEERPTTGKAVSSMNGYWQKNQVLLTFAEEGEVIPQRPKTYRLESTATSYSETAYAYDEVHTNRVVSIDEAGLITTLEYNAEGQLVGAVTCTEEYEDEEGNMVADTISNIAYAYDENGVLTSYTETAQMGYFGVVTTANAFEYNAEGQLVRIAAEESKIEFAYNAEGLVSEKVVYYAAAEEEEGEEGEEEGGEGPRGWYVDSKETYAYENGNLVRVEHYFVDWKTGDFYLAEKAVYKYDVKGNCVVREVYSVEGETETLYSAGKYYYNEKIKAEDVYSFEYPHFAALNPAKPSFFNILVKELSYYSYYDEEIGEVVEHTHELKVYNYSPEVALEPVAPVLVVVANEFDTALILTWTAFADAETFTIYQDSEPIAENIEGDSFEVTGLEYGEEYCFVVKAHNAVGSSVSSNEVCVTLEKPVAPVVTAEATSDTTILLTWTEFEGADSYNIYSKDTLVAEVYYATEYVVEGLEAETEYCFVVEAVSLFGTIKSEEVCVKTLADGILENTVTFNVYPNPASDRVFIATDANVEEVTVYTITGVAIYSEVDSDNTINVSDFASGVYFIKVRTDNGEAVQRFIKK